MLLKEMLRTIAGLDGSDGSGSGGVPGAADGLRRADGPDADVNGAGDVFEDEVGERHILIPRSWLAVELDGAAVDLVEDAVGDGDVFGYAAAEPEDRPARAEDAVGDGYEFAASEEGAGVVLGKDGAVADGYIFGAYEVEAVVVAVDAVVDVEAVHVDALALDDTNAVVGAIEQREIADGKVFAAVGEDLVGAAKAAEAAGGWGAADGRVKLCSLSVDGARALDSDVLCVDGEEKGIVAVFEGRVAGERDCVDRVILLAVAAAEYFSCGGNVKGTLLRSSTVPMGKVPAGTRTVPPPSL